MVDFPPLAPPRRSLSEQLAAHIAELIRRGAYRGGDSLPPITEIARRCEVSAPTVRQALARLEAVGLVEVRQGSGVYVRSRAAS
jgi:DNA-binding FadR family transcriptional regulator